VLLPPKLALAVVTLFGVGLATGCSDDDSSDFDELGPVEPGVSGQPDDAGVTPTPDQVEPSDAAPGQDAAELPALRSVACPGVELPTGHAPLDTIGALALTDRYLFIGSSESVYVFDRDGGCADTSLAAAPNAILDLTVRGLAAGVGDTFFAASEAGLTLNDASGATIAVCDSERSTAVSTYAYRAQGRGVVLGSRAELRRLDFSEDSCETAPLDIDRTAFTVLAVAIDPARRNSFFVGLQRTATAEPVLVREPSGDFPNPDVSGACSIAALCATPLGVATLDPTCGRLLVLEPDGALSTAEAELGAEWVPRAMAPVPGTVYAELTLASVSAADGRSELRVVSTRPD